MPIVSQGRQLILERELTRGEAKWTFTGKSVDGLVLAPATYKFVGVEDKIPTVELVEPAKDVTATSVWEILARVRAKDDFGLAEVGIILVVGDDMKLVAQRKISEKNVAEASEMGTAQLEEFPLTINDNLKIYAYARDHKPRDEARSVSNLRAIDIRQFKTRYFYVNPDDLAGMPMSAAQLARLGNLIELQRAIVSDTFVLKENGVPADGDLGKEADGIREREDQVSAQVKKLTTDVVSSGAMSREDLVLLDTAAQQMDEASRHLAARTLRPAYKQADRALTSLLEMRKLVMRLQSKARQQGTPSDGTPEESEKTRTLTQLAKEAERLAAEERDVRGQVAPELRPGLKLDVTRHQQQVAVADAGELFAALVAHPEGTELALQRMDGAEKAMQAGERTLAGASPQDAGPDLQTAEDLLLELAAQLRALDKKNLADTMAKLAEQAEKAQAKLKEEQQKPEGEQAGQSGDGTPKDKSDPGKKADAAQKDGPEKKGDQPGQKSDDGKSDGKNGEGKSADQKGDTAGDKSDGGGKKDGQDGKSSEGQKAGTAEDSKGKGREQKGSEGKKSADGEKPQGEGQPDLGKLANQADTIDDVLKSLSKGQDSGAAGGRLQELRERAGTDSLGKDLRDLDRERGKGLGHSQHAGELADRFGQLAEGLSREQRRMLQSKIELLADAKARTKEMIENGGRPPKDDGKGNGKDGKGEGQAGKESSGKDGQKSGAAAGAKPDGKGDGKAPGPDGKKPGDGSGTKPGDQRGGQDGSNPGEKGGGKAPGDKPGEGTKPGDQPGGQDGQKPGGKGAGKGEGEDGDQPGKGQNGKNGEKSRDGEGAKTGGKDDSGSGEGDEKSDAANSSKGEAGTQKEGRGAGGEADGPRSRGGNPKTQRGGHLGGQGTGGTRYLHDLEDFEDDSITELLKPLRSDLPTGAFDPGHLAAVDQRLKQMIDDLLRIRPSGTHDDRIPDQYTRMVEEYYRALSDDLGETKPAPKDK